MKEFRQAVLVLIVAGLTCHTWAAGTDATSNSFGALEVTVVSTNDLVPLAKVAVAPLPLPLTNAVAGPVQNTNYTGADGVGRLRVPAGLYWFSISKPDWLPALSQINIRTGQTNQVTIQLVPAPRITGTVRDPSGAPVAGVLVAFHPGAYLGASDYTEVKTDANGRYELILQQKSSALWDFFNGPINPTNSIMARDLGRNLVALREFTGMPANLDLTLQPGITLTGSVKSTQGAPVKNALVVLRFLSGNSLVELGPRPTPVDGQGSFSISALPQGREYYIWGVTAQGYGSAVGQLEAKQAQTNRYEFPTFVLKPANRKLAGRVLSGDWDPRVGTLVWKPLAGAWVSFSGEGQPEDSSTHTDNEGKFVFDAVCDGTLKIFASYNDPLDTSIYMSLNGGGGMEVEAGNTNILIQLRDTSISAWDVPTLITTGTVFDPAGKPASGVSLAVWRSANPFKTFASDFDGKYRVRWQGPGVEIKSVLVARDTEHNLAATHELKASTARLDVHLQPACTLSGSVQDADGRPLTNAMVALHMTLADAGAELARAQVDTNGGFSFDTLPQAGEYTLDVSVPGYGSATTKTNFVRRSHSLKLPPYKLTLANLQVAGTVVGLDGKPVPGMVVSASGQSQMLVSSTVTDARGHFVFDQVAHGPILLVAMQKTGVQDGRYRNSFVHAEGGDTNVVLKLVHP